MKLSDAVKLTIGGGWGEDEVFDASTPVTIVRGADFPDVSLGRFHQLPLRFEGERAAAKRKCQAGDILMEVSGGTRDRPTGRSVFVNRELVEAAAGTTVIPASFCRLMRVDPSMVHPRFVYYSLQRFYASGLAWSYQNQSTGISNFQFPRFLSEFELPDFDLATQTAIADVLGALDDKIAANDKAATLAGHLIRDLARPRDDATSAELASVAALVARGRAPKYVDHDGMIVINQKCVRGGSVGLDDARLTSGCSPEDERSLRRMDVLINSTGQGTLGRVGIWNRPAAATVDSHVTIVRVDSTKADPAYIAAQLIGREADFESLAEGSTGQTELARAHVLAFAVSLPTREHQELAGRKINALLDKIQTLSVESERLAATRDALLPELMSGRLAVGRATEVVP